MRLVAYVVEGDATREEARAFLDEVTSHPDFEPGFDFLGDRRLVRRIPSSGYVYAVLDEVNARHDTLGLCKWAVVITDNLAFGMTRTWGTLAERSGVAIRPFRTPGQAAAWLGLRADYSPLLVVPAPPDPAPTPERC